VAYDTRPAVKKIIKMFIALALLPAARIAEGLEVVKFLLLFKIDS